MLGLGISLWNAAGMAGGSVPTNAIRNRASSAILDRFGAYILMRIIWSGSIDTTEIHIDSTTIRIDHQ